VGLATGYLWGWADTMAAVLA
ncbi:TPA: hypothetical protein L5598_006777, partial [Pseudomonas aeruginosa]|nr:hypothetical protein [Pseudomonas aeruginosa]